MVLRSIYDKERELVSYNYFDIASGVGYEIFFGTSNDGTTRIVTEKVYSGMIHKNGAEVALALQNTEYEVFDIDFDIKFNKPRNIKGFIMMQIPFGLSNKDFGTVGFTYKITGQAFHVTSGGSETQIGSDVTGEYINIAALGVGNPSSHTSTLAIDGSASVTHFKPDETLRFTIKMTAKTDSGANKKIIGGMGCDPQNRSDFKHELDSNVAADEAQTIETDKPSRMEFHVPFVIPV